MMINVGNGYVYDEKTGELWLGDEVVAVGPAGDADMAGRAAANHAATLAEVSKSSVSDRLAAIEQAVSALASRDPQLAQLPEVLAMEVLSPVIETDLA